MLWIRFEFAMFQLLKKRNNIGIAAQLVPWRPVTEQENLTMPVNTSLSLTLVFPVMAIAFIFEAVYRSYVYFPPFSTLFFLSIHFPSLVVLIVVRQRNMSSPAPSVEHEMEQNQPQQVPDMELQDLEDNDLV